ncbi:MAG: 2-hydroxyacyl-CoA dehydratase [Desulfomonile tiedjei]|nr:2-hydroxyacyl-CoA dehydratase [Desulfomonile tiedjei]
MSSVLVKPFINAVSQKDKRLTDLSSRGHKILGYFCTYTPIELIHASGFVPVRVQGGGGATTKADTLTPSFICPYMRQALEKALTGQYDFLSGVVQAYTCDVACGLAKIWQENISGEIFHTIPFPYNDSEGSRAFFQSAIEELKFRMEEIGGEFTEKALDDSLELYREIRSMVMDLYRLRYRGKLPLSAGEFLMVIQSGFVTPPEDYRRMLEELIAGLRKTEASDAGGVPVLVSGSLVEEPGVLELLEECGGKVVADDLCTGLRHFDPPAGQGLTAIERLIDRYINRFPCPARSRAEKRAPLILRLIRDSQAKGVVFLFQKYCTPHLADHPMLAEELKRHGIPSVAIEMEEAGMGEGQVRTRLEAFFEMLGR